MKVATLAARSGFLVLSFLCIVCVSDDGRRSPEQGVADLGKRVGLVEEKVLTLTRYMEGEEKFCIPRSPHQACRKLVRIVKKYRSDIRNFTKKLREKENRLRRLGRMVRKVRDCPTGFRNYHDHCYLFSNQRLNWWNASQTCHLMGAQLLRIGSEKELNFTKKSIARMKPAPKRVWLGLAIGKFNVETGQLEVENLKAVPHSGNLPWHWVDQPSPVDTNSSDFRFLCHRDPGESCFDYSAAQPPPYCASMAREHDWRLTKEQCRSTFAFVCEID